MRRHAMATSSETNPRKPSGRRASMPSSRLYITVLAAAVAAFFVVPVAPGGSSADLQTTHRGERRRRSHQRRRDQRIPRIRRSGQRLPGRTANRMQLRIARARNRLLRSRSAC